MTNFKLFSLAAILSTVIATPVFAQQAVDEPGLQAFYQSPGVGSHDSATTAWHRHAAARMRARQ